MDRLSSCYFCGAALDASLEERPVVPSSLHPGTDSQKTVVLCGTCQRKLDAVLDTVLDAVEAGNVADADVTGGSQSGDSPAADEGDDLESALGDDEDILTSVGGDAADDAADASRTESGDDHAAADDGSESPGDAADADDSDGAETADEQKKPKYTKSRGAGFRREDDGPVETGSLTGGAFSGDDDDDESDAGSQTDDALADDSNESSDSGNGAPSADQSGADSGGPSADDSGSSSTGSSSADAGSDGGSSGEATGQRDVSMTRLENTKVMRLLENREFPVDRDEFVTVAANAYQVSRDDCDKVIDLAVEHDLLREENGQLYGGDS